MYTYILFYIMWVFQNESLPFGDLVKRKRAVVHHFLKLAIQMNVQVLMLRQYLYMRVYHRLQF